MKKPIDSSKGLTNAAPLSDDFPKVVIDQNAETFGELSESWPKADTSLRRFIRDQLRTGRWEKVFKRTPRGVVTAYRRKP